MAAIAAAPASARAGGVLGDSVALGRSAADGDVASASDDGDRAPSAALVPIRLPGPRSIGEQLDAKLTELGDALDEHLGRLTLDAVELHYDGRARRARIRVGGDTRVASMRVDGSVRFADGIARIDARLRLAIGARDLELTLPTFEVVPRSLAGERWLEMRLPLLTGSF